MSQDGEKKGISPEEVYTSLKVSKDISVVPWKWLKAELPRTLGQVQLLVATASLQTETVSNSHHTLSRIEHRSLSRFAFQVFFSVKEDLS